MVKEHAGQERATLNEVLTVGHFTEESYRRFLTISSAESPRSISSRRGSLARFFAVFIFRYAN